MALPWPAANCSWIQTVNNLLVAHPDLAFHCSAPFSPSLSLFHLCLLPLVLPKWISLSCPSSELLRLTSASQELFPPICFLLYSVIPPWNFDLQHLVLSSHCPLWFIHTLIISRLFMRWWHLSNISYFSLSHFTGALSCMPSFVISFYVHTLKVIVTLSQAVVVAIDENSTNRQFASNSFNASRVSASRRSSNWVAHRNNMIERQCGRKARWRHIKRHLCLCR